MIKTPGYSPDQQILKCQFALRSFPRWLDCFCLLGGGGAAILRLRSFTSSERRCWDAMAPVGSSGGKQQRRGQRAGRRVGARGRAVVRGSTLRKKLKWRPMLKQFVGSKAEGQGFAFWRKQKIQHDYKKLLRKEKRVVPPQENQFVENYPEHLKHLYLAEEAIMKKQRKHKKEQQVLPEEKDSTVVAPKVAHKSFKKKTSNQKAKEEYEKVWAEHAKQREEAEKRRHAREEAQKLYKQKKMETYKILSKKTKKGQPNFNVQMEYLLQKIQQNP